MKWVYSIKNKMTAAAALFVLCLLVLLSNFNDRQHTRAVNQSINTLYEDRLIAESYILKFTDDIHQIKEALINRSGLGDFESDSKISSILLDIEKVNKAYEKTKFTKVEEVKYDEFRGLCQQMGTHGIYNVDNKMNMANQALEVLNTLSTIQIEESKSIISKTELLFNSGKMSSDFAMAIVIIIGLTLQALVFSSKSFNVKINSTHPNLN